ncbi:unnamed protein product [Caretta caretta]
MLAVPKEYNLRRHFETKHPNLAKLNPNEKIIKAASLAKNLSREQQIFEKASTEKDTVTKTGVCSLIIWYNGKKKVGLAFRLSQVGNITAEAVYTIMYNTGGMFRRCTDLMKTIWQECILGRNQAIQNEEDIATKILRNADGS